jgi:methyltransferase (TIGR00027 family)
MTEPLVADVSDTARWVAVYRAWESARPDALFKDPFAERLAGERGRAIAAVVPRQGRQGWPMVMRTKVIDDLVMAAVQGGCDRVLNLAAGFDTRPYRLALPPSLLWIEADLTALMTEKERLLGDATPVCRLSRVSVDLTDASARRAFLEQSTQGAASVLVLTEGLLGYLDDDAVRGLAGDFAACPAVRSWVLDIFSPAILHMMQHGMGHHLSAAPLRFAPANGVAFFESLGWNVRELHPLFRAAAHAHRLPGVLRLFALFPDPNPRQLGNSRWSAVVQVDRPSAAPRRQGSAAKSEE